jgi:hypothetical protein
VKEKQKYSYENYKFNNQYFDQRFAVTVHVDWDPAPSDVPYPFTRSASSFAGT